MAMKDIEHIVVVMMENRSFDNLLGWLYDNETNPPPVNIPPASSAASPTFEGLKADTYYNELSGEKFMPVVRPQLGLRPAIPT